MERNIRLWCDDETLYRLQGRLVRLNAQVASEKDPMLAKALMEFTENIQRELNALNRKRKAAKEKARGNSKSKRK